MRGSVALAVAAVVAGVSAPAAAQRTADSPLDVSVTVGARSVELRGSTTKFREDVDLDDGLRILDLNLSYRPNDDEAPVDEIRFLASGLGGDPFQSLHLGVRKYGSFNLKLDRRRSDYFYEDTILPQALASVTGSTAGDFHHFDFERIRDSLALDVDISPATRFTLGLERQTRTGLSTTTLDVQRDEFELDKPLDESLERVRLGVEHDWERLTLIFEETFGEFENSSQIFLPGPSQGESLTNPAALQFFFFDQFYDYDTRSHLLRAVAQPSDRVDLSVFMRREDLDLNMVAGEQSEGMTFLGAPFMTDRDGTGQATRDIDLAGADLGIAVGERVRLVASARSSTLEQRGLSVFGAVSGLGDWMIETDGFEVGIETVLGRAILVSIGASAESRETLSGQALDGPATLERHDTDRDGFFARLRYSHDGLRLDASIDDNDIDDPFALAMPTDSRRYRVNLRYAFDNGLAIHAGGQRIDVGNEVSGWAADTNQTTFRLSYTWNAIEVAAGITRMELDRAIDQNVQAGFRQVLYPIAYGADARLRDLSMSWRVTDSLAWGVSYGSYDNRRSYPLERDDHRIFVEYALAGNYTLKASYRDLDYSEDAFDAYDADIIELGLRLSGRRNDGR